MVLKDIYSSCTESNNANLLLDAGSLLTWNVYFASHHEHDLQHGGAVLGNLMTNLMTSGTLSILAYTKMRIAVFVDGLLP